MYYYNSLCRDVWSCMDIKKKNDYAYLNPLWFNMYTDWDDKSRILKWIKAKKIFTRRYVFVPIVLWYVTHIMIMQNHLFDPHDTKYSLCWLYIGDTGAFLCCAILARPSTWVLRRGHACCYWIHLKRWKRRGYNQSSTGLFTLFSLSLSHQNNSC